MNETLLEAYDRTRRWIPELIPGGLSYELDGPLLRITGMHQGFVEGPPVLQAAYLDELIARQCAYFAARGEAFEWKTRGHDLPADLPDRLTRAGFVPETPETVLVGLAKDLDSGSPPPAGVTIRQVTADDDLRAIAAMESEVWGEDWSWVADDLIRRVADDPGAITILVAEAGDRVVSAAWLVHKPGTGFAGLWGGSTLKEFRGRGIYRALVAARARLAVAAGVVHLQVDASEDSRPILQRLGLQAVTTTTPYVWRP
ncbi:Acetyltransferase (GNAT) domain-containing protein [Nonomuraea solani]|uniref:Acetyltransferase (GNAT) domain-containing protein n=1 Tax=Nonomuraea solani TaxID=1144553 RepID=A0A1H5ZUC6_9ACTN|nr:GNAT family N-acetyltransferase [Nonomuraea solani]SEG40133.1 Acetyltransferase (GNAT) domain-containing protein [Nonomuraea solani]